MKVAVVGAGIAGLCAALRLSRRHDVTVVEREASAGGKIRSQRFGEFVFDWGPNGFLSNSADVAAVVREAGLENERVEASPAATKRYVYWEGKLHALPIRASQALSMSLLSARGKLRALGEPFVRAPQEDVRVDEDVEKFFTRRFGLEVAERIAAPALLGISGGDAKRTSLAALFPSLPQLERKYGSLIRAVAALRRKPGRLVSFGAAGLQRLTDSLAQILGDRLRLLCDVHLIEKTAQGWRVHYQTGHQDADCLVLSVPAYGAAELLKGCDPTLSELLLSIEYAPMRVVGIAFDELDVPRPLDGFGFLAARGQGIRILGAIYTSAIFPEQAPKKTAYLRVFLGGATDPDVLALDHTSARAIVRRDLVATLGIRAAPIMYHEALWPRAIPQYVVGHRSIVSSIEERASSHRGLALTGNAYRGIGLADTVRDAHAVADRLG